MCDNQSPTAVQSIFTSYGIHLQYMSPANCLCINFLIPHVELILIIVHVFFVGHKLESLGSQGRKPFAISMSQPECPTVNLAAGDQVDYTRWFMALENASKADSDVTTRQMNETRVSLRDREKGCKERHISLCNAQKLLKLNKIYKLFVAHTSRCSRLNLIY